MNVTDIPVPDLTPYLSFDFLIRSEVIIPSIVVVILGWLGLRYQQKAENDENFITLKFKFTELWGGLALEDSVTTKDYKDCNKKEKFKAFAVIEFFSVVWFLHIRKRTSYSQEWEHNTRHVFKHKVIQSAFSHIVLEKQQSFNQEWIKYIQKIIQETANKE